MKKNNKMMRYAAIVLALVLATTCIVGNTFAKYTTSVSSSDNARVANWGFERTNSIDITDLFAATYDGNGDVSVNSANGTDNLIAPGTEGVASFVFAYDETAKTAPEVAYSFTVDTTGSSCDATIQANDNIRFVLDPASAPEDFDDYTMTWTQLIAAIKALSGDASGTKNYAANTLPTAFGTGDTEHFIYWAWNFSEDAAGDTYDTGLGNANTLAPIQLSIAITATQLDTYTTQ